MEHAAHQADHGKVAVVLGGAADQVPLVQALSRRGYRTVLIDYYPDPPARAFADQHYQVSTLDPLAVEAVLEKERPALVTSIGNDLVVAELARSAERFGLPAFQTHANALKATDKQAMKRAFLAAGIPTAPVIDPRTALASGSSHNVFPLVGKPLVGYGGRGVRKLADRSELETFIAEQGGPDRVHLEGFMEGGMEISVDCFVSNGRAKVLMVSRLHQVPHLAVGFSTLLVEFPFGLTEAQRAELDRIARMMAVEFGIVNGPFFFQAKVLGEHVLVIEMGARVAGGRKFHFVRRVTGFDPLEAQLDVLEGKAVQVEPDPGRDYFTTAMLFARSGQVAGFVGPPEGILEDVMVVRGPGYLSGGTCSASDRIAVLTTCGATRQEALDHLRQALAATRIPDPQGRDLFWRELYDGLLD